MAGMQKPLPGATGLRRRPSLPRSGPITLYFIFIANIICRTPPLFRLPRHVFPFGRRNRRRYAAFLRVDQMAGKPQSGGHYRDPRRRDRLQRGVRALQPLIRRIDSVGGRLRRRRDGGAASEISFDGLEAERLMLRQAANENARLPAVAGAPRRSSRIGGDLHVIGTAALLWLLPQARTDRERLLSLLRSRSLVTHADAIEALWGED